MFFLDFGSLWFLAFLLVGMLNVIPSIGEKAALSFSWALGLKSLVLFFWMAGAGEFPSLLIQTGLSLAGLVFVLILLRGRRDCSRGTTLPGLSLKFFSESESSANSIFPSPSPEKKSPFVMTTVGVLGILFALSFANAWFFPVTEADGIWHHIKGMVFLHEGQFDSQTIVSQFRQYPPLLPLLFAYLMAFDVGGVKIIFPFIYLCLLVIFYHRVDSLAKNKNIAAAFTLVLGTTPYFWWHSFLPFLDLTTGFYYSTGALYWFFLIGNVLSREKPEGRESNPCSWAFLSGTLFGLAAWSRLEFLLYNAIPLLILIYVLDRNTALTKRRKNAILLCLAAPPLIFSSLWFATLVNFDSPLDRRVLAVGLAGLGTWLLVLLFLKWDFYLSKTRLMAAGALAVLLYLVLMLAGGPRSTSLVQALLTASIRSISVHVFYLCTLFLGVFLFKEKQPYEPEKLLGWFLLLYPLAHFLIFSYSEPKWSQISTYFDALLVHPGRSINLSDARGMMAFYPILIFFIAGTPLVKRGFENE